MNEYIIAALLIPIALSNSYSELIALRIIEYGDSLPKKKKTNLVRVLVLIISYLILNFFN